MFYVPSNIHQFMITDERMLMLEMNEWMLVIIMHDIKPQNVMKIEYIGRAINHIELNHECDALMRIDKSIFFVVE